MDAVRRQLVAYLACAAASVSGAARAVSEDDIVALAKAAERGERNAVRRLFALRPGADGAVGEDIDVALGAIVQAYPQLFLDELKRSSQTEDLDGLLGNLGLGFVDDCPAQLNELDARRSALASVQARALRDVRSICLARLERIIAHHRANC